MSDRALIPIKLGFYRKAGVETADLDGENDPESVRDSVYSRAGRDRQIALRLA